MRMKLVKAVLDSARCARRGLLKTWATTCDSYFHKVSQAYPELVKTNVRQLGEATIDLLESGQTADRTVIRAQYPCLSLDPFRDPVTRALYEVGAIRLDPSGDAVVEPTPAALLRGLARLALPRRFLHGIVNAARAHHRVSSLNDGEFDALNDDLFRAVRRGLTRSIGDRWFHLLNQTAYYLQRGMILPCTVLPRSQEFYEEGINFYRGQGADSEVFVYSTTSGLVVPGEFRGDMRKNHYRYQYFTKGILGDTACARVYQWERYRTARELALGYERSGVGDDREQYVSEAYSTLGRFARAPNLGINEVDRFSAWKSWCTLVGPERQQLSIRDPAQKLKIGHGLAYDAAAFRRRSDLMADLAKVVTGFGVVGALVRKEDFITHYGPAVTLAATACALGGVATSRLNSLIRRPLLHRCREDRNCGETRVVKARGLVLSTRRVRGIVDTLLSDGLRILASESAMESKASQKP